MLNNQNSQQLNILWLVMIVTIVIATIHYFQGNVGFNLADEGFLWYGVKRVLAGEVPIRDFMAYDVGRYYWSALWLKIFGDSGILSLRLSVSIFQGLGLLLGFLTMSEALKQQKTNFIYCFVTVVILILWMFPRHKLFDISLSIFLIYGLTYLINRPILARYFNVGILVGLIAVFGRNHGVYGFFASFALIFWLFYKKVSNEPLSKALNFWLLGVVIGFSPILLMMIFVPEFATAFLDSVFLLFNQKATNLTLPVPWPWTVNLAGGLNSVVIGNLIVGVFFVLLILIGLLSASILIFYKNGNIKLFSSSIASAFLILPYAHFAFSRADLSHLAQGIFPLLILMFTLIFQTKVIIRWFLILVLLSFTMIVMLPVHPLISCYMSNTCTEVNLKNDSLLVSQGMKHNLSYIDNIVSTYAFNDESFLILPSWPAVYAIYDRVSPIWELYAVFPRSRDFEIKEIEKIKQIKPKFVLIEDIALDGNDRLRFKYTHPTISKYIDDHFLDVSDDSHQSLKVFIEKER